MKENTLIYVGLGALALILLSKKKQSVTQVYPVNSSYIPPAIQQPSQSLLLPILSSAATIVQSILSNNKQQANVSQGYNADGTIAFDNTTQDSINQLNTGSGLQTTNTVIPVSSGGTSNPALAANNVNDAVWTDFIYA